MCFRKRKKQIDSMQAKLNELTDIVKNQRFIQYEKDSKELAETKQLLSKIVLPVKNVQVADNESGHPTVIIRYEPISIVLNFDDKGETERNEMFYAMNMLNLTPLKDMEKIQKIIVKQQEEINKN